MMAEFKKIKPKVVKPGERIEFLRDSMDSAMHGNKFYAVFYKLAWLRHEGKVSVRILRKNNAPGQHNWYIVAFADINKDESWQLLYTRLHEIGQIGKLNDGEPVECVHIEFLSEESAEVVIYLSAKEDETEDVFGPLDVNGPSSVKPTVIF